MMDELKIITNEFWNNKKTVFFLFQDEDDNYGMFYGQLSVNKNLSSNLFNPQDIKDLEKEYYLYTNNKIYFIQLEDEDKKSKFDGEQITFKNNSFPSEFIKSLFDSIYSWLSTNKWETLLEGLENISEFLYSATNNQAQKRLQGYLGEMGLIYYLMKNNQITHHQEIAKVCFQYYQKTLSEKHDFRFNPKLRLEVKSTQGEGMNFKMKASQQVDVGEIHVFYAFVKYNRVAPEFGKNLNQVAAEIAATLDLSDPQFPNHLLASVKNKDYEGYYIDTEQIEVYLLDNNELPKFVLKDNAVSEIKYSFNVLEYLKAHEYHEKEAMDNFYQFVIGGKENGK